MRFNQKMIVGAQRAVPVNNVFVLCGHNIAKGNAAIYAVNLRHAVSLHRCVNFIAFHIPIYR